MLDLSCFDNLHKGQRGFIIGGGPSINKINNNLIEKLNQEYLVGGNKAYKKFLIDYLVFIDPTFYRDFYHEFANLDCIKFAHLGQPSKDQIKNFYKFERDRDHKNILPSSFNDSISLKNNTGSLCLRIAYLLGFNPIYLIGFDLNVDDIKKGNPNFHTDYIEKNYRPTPAKSYGKFFESIKRVVEELRKESVEVYSCSENSRLNRIVDYVDLNNLF